MRGFPHGVFYLIKLPKILLYRKFKAQIPVNIVGCSTLTKILKYHCFLLPNLI